MNFKGVGTVFCFISALLISVRYIAASLYLSGSSTISSDGFQIALTSVGPVLVIAAIAALVAGICFLALGFAKDGKKQ